ncbi:DUF1552 domain-containing protein [Bradyrhizobium iriomotense]|uniref:DUF1552 domain-containing protein n=1 Tax=Bradyrhizobium iriomotense TaxID=441950 RepID=A0ABQ6BB36_9BRAD|nr:DUF1552 domain-containing protein [Bradyrhizobium iriomotense]GLR90993.1 hypothetical protein GCM10007857_77090 [Bradyrhizobium iriomotense]
MAWTRRRVLRGLLNGGVVTVSLPLLNCFLNGNGTALASGRPMPVRFGTWFWGLGMQKEFFVPKKTGANFDLPYEIEYLKGIQQHINLLSNFNVFLDDNPALGHYAGWVATRSGRAPKSEADFPGETLDITIANQIGCTTRFKALTANATGEPKATYSHEGANSPSVPEYSPLSFYQRLFGPDFQDPNAPIFKPSPAVMVRKSVLSGVMDDIKDVNRRVGAEDRVRLDQYLTSVRHLEQQFDQQLTKPEPIAACIVPQLIKEDPPPGNESAVVAMRHKMMTDLMVMAVACDQTRVFNMAYQSGEETTQAGYEKTHHIATHEERIDEATHLQAHTSWFTRHAMAAWAEYVDAFTQIREGDGTLLDNCLIMADSDHGLARIHSYDNMVMFTAGKAGGRLKTGLHVDVGATATTRLSYTILRTMGVDISSFGAQSNSTSKEIGEILV